MGKWEWLQNQEGVSYFFNNETQELVWDKPEVFMTALEKEMACGEWIWCPHEEHAFLPGRVLERSEGKASAIVETIAPGGERETSTVSEKQCQPIASMVAISENLDDLVQLAWQQSCTLATLNFRPGQIEMAPRLNLERKTL